MTFKTEDYREGGAVLTEIQQNSGRQIYWLIKPGWAAASVGIFRWEGLERKNASEKAMPNVVALAAVTHNDRLLIIWNDNSSIFAALIDSTLDIISLTPISSYSDDSHQIKAKFEGKSSENEFLVIIGKKLYTLSINRNNGLIAKMISEDIVAACGLYHDFDRTKTKGFAYIAGKADNGFLYQIDSLGGITSPIRIQIAENIKLEKHGKLLISTTWVSNYSNTLINILNTETGKLDYIVNESYGELTGFYYENSRASSFYLTNSDEGYRLVFNELKENKNHTSDFFAQLPVEMIEPIAVWSNSNLIFALFRNGIASVSTNGILQSLDYYPFGEKFKDSPELFVSGDRLVLSSTRGSVILTMEENKFWYVNRFLENKGLYIFPGILLIILIITIQLYRHQKRFLNTILNLPTSGMIFYIDKYGHLKKANAVGMEFLDLNDSIPLGKDFHNYCLSERTKTIAGIIDRALISRVTVNQKTNILIENNLKEFICTAIPVRNIAGAFRGVVFTGIDITEQLERKRLSNWAALAHDMQTNLSTIKLNAEQLECEPNCSNQDRKTRIIHQAHLLIQRVRDIVTVGRNDEIETETVDSDSICREVRNEFDELLFPNVTFELKTDSFRLNCDKPKMIRAIRNAIENGIRSFKGNPGIVTISCSHDNRFAYFSVRDNGIGMDSETKAKILTPYFTTAKKQGGSGIGTMIMQHVAELHGGEISINSEQGLGTEVIFSIPLFTNRIKSKIK